MNHRPSRAHVRRFALGLSLALLAATLAVPAIAESLSNKSFTAVFSSDGQGYEVELKNTSVGGDGLTLGSARITTTTATSKSTTETFRRLDIAPGDSRTLTLGAAFECGVTTFAVQAKQSNNFNGTGNDLDLDLDNSMLSVEVPCDPDEPELFLSFSTQPSDAKVNTAIAPAPAVQIVEKVNGDDVAFAKSGVEITMSLVDGTLAGTPLTVPTNDDGLAIFSNLKVTTTGLGFELEAAASGFDSVTSASFDVFDDLCDAETICSTTAGGLRNSGDLLVSGSGTALGGGGGLSISVDPSPNGSICQGVPDGFPVSRIPNEVTVIGDNLVDKTAILRIDKSYDQLQTNNGVSFYQVCAEPIAPFTEFSTFTDIFGNVVWSPEDPNKPEDGDFQTSGFLPDCKSADDAPCIESRVKRGGDPVITVRWGSGSRWL